jgi:EmrB/QacA subfamily drug resistance transporter
LTHWKGIYMSLGSGEADTTNAETVGSVAPAPDPVVLLADPRRWHALGVIAIASLMVILDSSIVNLALPSAEADLHISAANQQWMITAYTLAFGGLLLLGGRAADFVGRKRMFIVGLLGFAAASAIGGLAPSQGLLFAARALQGGFAAFLVPAALSLLTVTFHDPKERAKAFGVYGAIAGGGSALGLLLGGVLTEYASWRWCLLVNVPIALLAVVGALKELTESKAGGDARYDFPGAVTVTGGLLALVYGFNKAAPVTAGDPSRWTEPGTLVWFGLALVLLVSFFVIETHTQHPLLPMRVLLDRNRGGTYLVMLMVGIGLFGMFLFLGLYLQVVHGYSPLRAGFAFLPFSVSVILTAGVAANLLPRFGPRLLVVPGLLVAAMGLLLLTRLTPTSSYDAHVLPSMIMMGVGLALVFIPMASTALHAIGGDDAGVASALINACQQVGASLGIALLNTVAAASTTAYLAAHRVLPPQVKAALTHGYTQAFLVGAGFLLIAALVAGVLINIDKTAAAEGDPAPETGDLEAALAT